MGLVRWILLLQVAGCAGNGLQDLTFEKESSQPINKAEALQYKQSLLRCFKTGGSRVVKIHGQLQCF